jgi:triosephosphate isomerase
MRPVVIGNWKMNPATARDARRLADGSRTRLAKIRGVDAILLPPFPFLSDIASRVGRTIALGAQDVYSAPTGAFTGEVSPLMLRDAGCRYVLIGHSERRKHFHETNEEIQAKVRAAVAHRLIPIIVVGDELAESHAVLPTQIRVEVESAIRGVPKAKLANAIFAYEPVWAIGTGKADSPDNATRRAIYIRKLLTGMLGHAITNTIRIVYGGSVVPKNAASFIADDVRGMEGLLVGGASLSVDSFTAIVRAVAPERHA